MSKIHTKERSITFRIIPNQSRELDRFSVMYGQSKSDLIREAIQVWLIMQWKKENNSSEVNNNAVA